MWCSLAYQPPTLSWAYLCLHIRNRHHAPATSDSRGNFVQRCRSDGKAEETTAGTCTRPGLMPAWPDHTNTSSSQLTQELHTSRRQLEFSKQELQSLELQAHKDKQQLVMVTLHHISKSTAHAGLSPLVFSLQK